MYGVVEISGHQYSVQVGDVIDVEKLAAEQGAEVELDKVLFIGGEKPLVGAPTVADAKVKAHVIKHDRSRKIIVYKRKPGAARSKNGHRQHYTSLLITEITGGEGLSQTIDPESKTAKKFLK